LVEIWLPYGQSEVPVRVPEERLVDLARVQYSGVPIDSPTEARNLIGSNDTFQEKARNAKKICIVVGQCGNGTLVIALIRTLLEILGSQSVKTTILCTSSSPELNSKMIPETNMIQQHDARTSPMSSTPNNGGTLSRELNSEFLGADLRVVLGELKPHHFLKYAGICDTVFPALASENSVRTHLANRPPGYTAEDLRRERDEITYRLGNIYALGVVLDSGKEPLHISFGAFNEVVSTLQTAVDANLTKEVTRTAEIVLMSAGGTPEDISLVRAVETFPVGVEMLKQNGALIVAAECIKGHGDTEFYGWTRERKQTHHLQARLRHRFNYDGFKAVFLQRILASHRIYLVSTIPEYYVENVFGLRSARTVNAALQAAQRALGAESTISVIPDASRVNVRTHSEPEATKTS
jgi:nickel-dependent lactate racemase